MSRRSFLAEGLKVGDLKNLVRPLLSIDEYQSKLGDDSEVIVTAFFVDDEDPALDLNRFIEKSDIDLLDSDVSPAPNEDGLYLVFVEMPRDEDFPKTLMTLVASLTGLVGDLKWKFKPYGHEQVELLTEKNISKLVELDRSVVLRRIKAKEAEEAKKAEAKRKAKEAEKAKQEQEKAAQAAQQPQQAQPAQATQSQAQPATPAGGLPAGQPAEVPAEEPAEQPAEQPAEEPVEQPAEVPAEEPAEQPAEQPAEEPAEQPAEVPPQATAKKAKESAGSTSTATRLYEFFRPSELDHLQIARGGVITMGDRRDTWAFRVRAFGRIDRLMEGLEDKPFDLSPESLAACRRLGYLLGHGWEVQRLDEGFVLAHGDHAIVLTEE